MTTMLCTYNKYRVSGNNVFYGMYNINFYLYSILIKEQ